MQLPPDKQKPAPIAVGTGSGNINSWTAIDNSEISGSGLHTQGFSADNRTLGDIPGIASRLNGDCENVCRQLLGDPNPRLCTKSEWRWGEHGRFKLSISGLHRGKWSDFRSGEHGDQLDLIGRELGLDARGAIDWSADWIGGEITGQLKCPNVPRSSDRDSGTAATTADLAANDERERQKRKARALAIWAEAAPVPGTLSERYLTVERGLPLTADILAADAFRHHKALYYDGTHVPGIVALMRDPVSAEPVGIQRTFLTADGKKIKRRMLGSAGVVMLSPSDDVEHGLGLAEGMENGLAVMTLGGWRPMWAAMPAGAIRNFPVLDGIDALTVFADPEQVGMDAARACCERWADAGREATSVAPPDIQHDWNDELRGTAA